MHEIQSCDKFTGENHQITVKLPKHEIMGIHIIHELLDPTKTSPCNNKKCSHLCFLKRGGQEAVCQCPSGKYQHHVTQKKSENFAAHPRVDFVYFTELKIDYLNSRGLQLKVRGDLIVSNLKFHSMMFKFNVALL